jgi:hypothetical protein
MRKLPAVVLLSVTVPALSALPVVTRPAPAPHPVVPSVWSAPASGVDRAALAGPAGRASTLAAVGSGNRRDAAATRPALLTGVRHTRSFELVGVTWRAGTGGRLGVLLRTHGAHGWTGWSALDPSAPAPDSDGPTTRAGTEPSWTGPSDAYQLRVDVRSGRLPQDVRVELVDPGTSPADAAVGQAAPASSAQAAAAQPTIYTRRQWGADEALRSGSPSYSPTIRTGFVHHTVNANDYTKAEVPAIIRGIYAYHTLSNGWSDIGYNFLVDKFGRLWEGRYGGMARPVIGAHTGGFNYDTFAVSAIGNFETASAPAAMTDAIAHLMAWKLSLSYRNPLGYATLTSVGGGTSKYSYGTNVKVHVISGHRDVGLTACPGINLYNKVPAIRTEVAALMGAGLTHPSAGVSGGLLNVSAGVLRPTQHWTVTLSERQSGEVFRRWTGTGPVTLSVPLTDAVGQQLPSGRYRVLVESNDGSRVARPWSAPLTVEGANRVDGVDLPDGTARLVSRRPGGSVQVRMRKADGTLGSWFGLGGVTLGQPSIGVNGNGALVVAVRGTDNALYLTKRRVGQPWSAWRKLAGTLTGSPTVVSSGTAEVDIVGAGARNRLTVWKPTRYGTWATATAAAAPALMPGTAPGAVRTTTGTLHVVVHAADDSTWYGRDLATGWLAWQRMGTGFLDGDVDLASPDGKTLVASRWGPRHRAQAMVFSGGHSGTWAIVSGDHVATPPTLTSGLSRQQLLFGQLAPKSLSQNKLGLTSLTWTGWTKTY